MLNHMSPDAFVINCGSDGNNNNKNSVKQKSIYRLASIREKELARFHNKCNYIIMFFVQKYRIFFCAK